MTAGLILKDDIEQVQFVGDSTYKLLDETFELGYPKMEIQTHRKTFYAGREAMGAEFGPRKVSFSFLVTGTTDQAADAAVNKISRMLIRSQSDVYMSGGQYSQLYLDEGKDTGDNGLVLRIKFNAYTETIDTESWTSPSVDQITTSGYYTLRVISADMSIQKLFSNLRKTYDITNDKFYRQVELTLECEPFMLAPARIITSSADISSEMASAGFSNMKAASIPSPYNINSGYTNSYNKFTIPAADIKGDAPMPIRLTMASDGFDARGLIVARDAGISLLNCPSVPVQTSGTARNDIFVYGQIDGPEYYKFRIQTQASGVTGQYRTSDDDGLTYTSWSNIVIGKSNQIVGSDSTTYNAYVVFPSKDTGVYSAAGTWTLNSHQSYLPGSGATNYNTLTASLFNGPLGEELDEFQFISPPGCYSKYAVFANIIAQDRHEYRMKVRYFMPGNDASWYYTEDNQYTWTQMGDRNYHDCVVNLGLLDFSPRGMPSNLHPETAMMGEIKVYARNLQYNSIPSGSIEIRNIWLVPVQDRNSFMFAAWQYGGEGVAVFSNYDAANPYRTFETANWTFPYSGDTDEHPVRASIPMDGTMAGSIPMLIPGQKNTIMIMTFGTFATVADWRAKNLLPTNAKEISFGLAGRPRYLSVPGE